MSTKILEANETIKVENPKKASEKLFDDLNALPEVKTRTRKQFLLILNLLSLFFIGIFLARVPYIGSYPDAYIFEFLFGNTKYILYIFLLIWSIFKIFSLRIVRLFTTKRFILGYVLLIIGLLLTFAIIQKHFLSTDIEVNLKSYMEGFTNWANNTQNQVYHHFFPNIWSPESESFIDAGIIGTLLVIAWAYIATVLLGLAALILIVLSFSIFLRRKNGRIIIFFKKWLIHLLGGDLYNHVYDELSVKKHDVSPIIHQSTQIQKEANKIGQLTPPISFLTDTSIDSYYDNKNQAQKFEQTISKFLKKIEIDASCQNIVVMPQYVEIIFEIANVQGIDEILKNQNQLLTILKIDRFNISRKGNIVMFEIPNKTISKISIRQIFNTTKIEQNDKSIVGLTLENTPLQLDMKKNHNILIVGKRGSGAAMLLTVLLISYAYINPPTNVEYILLSLIGDKTLKSFDNLPHMLTPTLNNFEACINKLHQVMDEMKERENKFKDAGAKTLEDFNRFQSNPHSKLKKIILVISGFDNLLRNSLQNLEILHNILKQGPELGINTILLSINVNNELLEPKIYELIDVKFVLQLESEHESLKIFDNYRGLQLYGNGDGYCFEGENEKIRFQTCYLNINELTEIIRIIATFYKTKDQIN